MSLPSISRPNYDKPHRCPAWSGPAFKDTDVYTCEGGSIRIPGLTGSEAYPGETTTRFGRCTTCPIITLPYATRWVDPSWLTWRASWVYRTRVRDRIEDHAADLRWHLAVFAARITRGLTR